MRRKNDIISQGPSKEEQKIIAWLRKEPVPEVPQEEVQTVCRTATAYYTRPQGAGDAGFWLAALSCLTGGTALLWILAAFLLGSCAALSALTGSLEAEPFALLIALSPVPMLSFAIRELQYRDSSLVQLEKTCKYSPDKIYFARLWIGMAFNMLFVALAGTAFPRSGPLLKLLFLAFTAMFLMGAAALAVMSFLESALPLSLMLATWVPGAFWLLCQDGVLDLLMGVGTGILAAGAAAGLGLFAAAAVKTTKRLYA